MSSVASKRRSGQAVGPTVVDLFAGCGGLSLGLENAGFRPVYVNELVTDAMATYLVNRLHQFPDLASSNSADIFVQFGYSRSSIFR